MEVVLAVLAAHPEAAAAKDSNGNTLLNVAMIYSASTEVVLVVLAAHPEAGAAKTRVCDLPLHWAVRNKASTEVVLVVLAAHPAAAAAKGSNGNTPLHEAVINSASTEVVLAVLVAHPEAAAAKNSNGNTPLYWAVRNKASTEVVLVLQALQGSGKVLDLSGRRVVRVFRESEPEPEPEPEPEVEPLPAAGIARMLACCAHITELKLSSCDLLALPTGVATLTSLISLNLAGNRILNPLALADLTSLHRLRTLDLSDMPPLRDLAELSRAQGAQAVLAFLKDAHDDPQRAFSLKVVLAGPSCAGKSSLLQAMLGKDESDRLVDEDRRTIGIDVEHMDLSDQRCEPDQRGVRFLVRECASYQLAPCLPQSSWLFLVYSVR